MNRIAGFATAVLMLLANASSTAATVHLTAVADTSIYADSGLLSNSAGDYLFAGTNAFALPRRALLRFDASVLPAAAVIDAATLSLRLSPHVGPGGGSGTFGLHRLLADWGGAPQSDAGGTAAGGGGGGAFAVTGDATWTHAFLDVAPWSTPGGDFAAPVSAVAAVGGADVVHWASAGLATDVQAWLDDPASNFGWILRGPEGVAASARRFGASDSVDPAWRPQLTLEYHVSAVPLPAAGLLLAPLLPALGLRRRRRRTGGATRPAAAGADAYPGHDGHAPKEIAHG